MLNLFYAACVLTFTIACGGPIQTMPDTVPQAAALQAALDEWATGTNHHGVSAAVIFADGQSWEGTAGFADVTEPISSDHLIQIASITKTMTGAVILQLADKGRLSLDDTVGRWLPSYSNVDPSITIRQLLNHTSGVANYTRNPALSAAIVAEPNRIFSPSDLLGFVESARFAPGARTEYTNTSFVLLGQIAERVTGESIVALYEERLWGPLGLSEIYLPGYQSPPGAVAHAMDRNGVVVDPVGQMGILSVGHSAFGLLASARTVAAWGHAFFTGNVISDSMQGAMRILVPAAGNIPGESGAGLGIRSYGYLGRTQCGHSGGGSFGSSLMLFDPQTGITVAVVANQGGRSDHFTLTPALLEIADL